MCWVLYSVGVVGCLFLGFGEARLREEGDGRVRVFGRVFWVG